jgi:hypothetical protein
MLYLLEIYSLVVKELGMNRADVFTHYFSMIMD